MYMSATGTQQTVEARVGGQIPWSWTYRAVVSCLMLGARNQTLSL